MKSIQNLSYVINYLKKIDKEITIFSNEDRVKTFLKSEREIQKNLFLLSLLLSFSSIIGTIILTAYYIKKTKKNFKNYERLGFRSNDLMYIFFLQNVYIFISSIVFSIPVVGIKLLINKSNFLEDATIELTILLILTIILPQFYYLARGLFPVK